MLELRFCGAKIVVKQNWLAEEERTSIDKENRRGAGLCLMSVKHGACYGFS